MSVLRTGSFAALALILGSCDGGAALEFEGELGVRTDAAFVADIPAVAVSIGGGDERWFLVDTGAPFTALDSDLYRFPDGPRDVALFAFDLEFPRLEAVVFDVLPANAAPLPLGGLLGGDILSHFALTCDRAGGQLWLDGPVTAGAAGPPIAVSAEVKGGGRAFAPGSCPGGCGVIDLPASRFLVTASVEDLERPLRLLVDTGASDVVVTEAVIDELADAGRPRLDGVTVTTAAGPIVAYVTRVWELDLGSGARRQSVPVLVLPDPDFFAVLEDEVGERVDGIVGEGFFRHFVTTVDYPGRQLLLAPYPDDSHLPPGRYASLGFSLSREGDTWRTAAIQAGSGAEAAGITAGEIVAAIDGAAISDLSGSEIDALIELLVPGAPVEVELDRGGAPVAFNLEVIDLLPPFTRPGAS